MYGFLRRQECAGVRSWQVQVAAGPVYDRHLLSSLASALDNDVVLRGPSRAKPALHWFQELVGVGVLYVSALDSCFSYLRAVLMLL